MKTVCRNRETRTESFKSPICKRELDKSTGKRQAVLETVLGKLAHNMEENSSCILSLSHIKTVLAGLKTKFWKGKSIKVTEENKRGYVFHPGIWNDPKATTFQGENVWELIIPS